MENDILCKSCAHWVDCGERDGKPWGFCISRDLYTNLKQFSENEIKSERSEAN